MKLSILIPTTHQRAHLLAVLRTELEYQIKLNNADGDVEILTEVDNPGESPTGTKRNKLLHAATGEYVCHIDDDDEISFDYIKEVLEAIAQSPDVVGFKGWMTTDGANRVDWRISKDLPYCAAIENGVEVYLRFPNHLSPILRKIAIQVGFPDLVMGEDYWYAETLHNLGLIKTEVYIDKFLYHYKFASQKVC